MSLKIVGLFCFFAAFQVNFIEAFRSDYTYIPSTGAYYKYHPETATWEDARSTCQSEGAILFHPENEDELNDVFRVLNISRISHLTWDWLATGISDLEILHEYKTVDGRPISQVFRRWKGNEPIRGPNNQYRCGFMDVETRSLIVHSCSHSSFSCRYRYICKNKQIMESMVTEAVTDVTTIAAYDINIIDEHGQTLNETEAFSDPERQAEDSHQISRNQTSATQQQVDCLKLQVAFQNTALERLIEVLSRQTDAMQKQAATQSEKIGLLADALNRMTDTMQKQAATQSESFNRQTTVIQQHLEIMAVNQTTLMERQAQALEKIAEDSGQEQQ